MCFDKRCNKWRSYFTYDKRRQIGAFKTREEGVLALDMLRNKLDHSNINDKTSVDAIVKQVYDTIKSQNLTIEAAKDQSNELHILFVESIVKRVSNKTASAATSNMSNKVAAKDSIEFISSASSSQNITSEAVNDVKIASSSEASSSSNTSNTATSKNATIENDGTRIYETAPTSEVKDATESKRYMFKCATTSNDVQTNRWRAHFHYDKTRCLGYFATRKLGFLALKIIRKKLEESTDHTVQSIDEAVRFTKDILSSLSNANIYLERAKHITKTKNNEEGSTSTPSSSLPSNKTKANITSTASSTTAQGMNQGNNSNQSSRLPPNNNNNDDNNHENNSKITIGANTKWLPCENPWGDNGYCNEDFILLSSNPHNIRDLSPSNKILFPMHPVDNTNDSSSFSYKALSLTRDRDNKFPWGFKFDYNSNTSNSLTSISNDACVITSITPCSPAEAAKDVSGVNDDNGLQVGDVIIAVDGQHVAGMTDGALRAKLQIANCRILIALARIGKS